MTDEHDLYGYCFGLDHQPISALEAGELLADIGARRVSSDVVVVRGRPIMVSTVFLVIDHSFGIEADPVLYETMTFDEDGPRLLARYKSRAAAAQGHAHVVADLMAMDELDLP